VAMPKRRRRKRSAKIQIHLIKAKAQKAINKVKVAKAVGEAKAKVQPKGRAHCFQAIAALTQHL